MQATLPTVTGELDDEIMERHFLYAAVWSFGGHLSPSHQILFNYWLRSKCRKELDEELCIPEAGNVSSLSTCVKCVLNQPYIHILAMQIPAECSVILNFNSSCFNEIIM